jgi:hypothetical protein
MLIYFIKSYQKSKIISLSIYYQNYPILPIINPNTIITIITYQQFSNQFPKSNSLLNFTVKF